MTVNSNYDNGSTEEGILNAVACDMIVGTVCKDYYLSDLIVLLNTLRTSGIFLLSLLIQLCSSELSVSDLCLDVL